MVQWVCACVSLPWILNYFYMCAERKREGEGEKEIERKLDKTLFQRKVNAKNPRKKLYLL